MVDICAVWSESYSALTVTSDDTFESASNMNIGNRVEEPSAEDDELAVLVSVVEPAELVESLLLDPLSHPVVRLQSLNDCDRAIRHSVDGLSETTTAIGITHHVPAVFPLPNGLGFDRETRLGAPPRGYEGDGNVIEGGAQVEKGITGDNGGPRGRLGRQLELQIQARTPVFVACRAGFDGDDLIAMVVRIGGELAFLFLDVTLRPLDFESPRFRHALSPGWVGLV
jgi:hypothetical protein